MSNGLPFPASIIANGTEMVGMLARGTKYTVTQKAWAEERTNLPSSHWILKFQPFLLHHPEAKLPIIWTLEEKPAPNWNSIQCIFIDDFRRQCVISEKKDFQGKPQIFKCYLLNSVMIIILLNIYSHIFTYIHIIFIWYII